MKEKLTREEFIVRSIKIHNNKYSYDKVKYINARSNVVINCLIHGDFQQTPDNHLHGQKCPKCAILKRTIIRSSTLQDFVLKASKIHENKYNYSKSIYTNCDNKLIIICPLHGDFSQTPYSHLIGRGCPKCNSSKGELKIVKWLTKNNIEYIHQKTFNDCKNPRTGHVLKFDFYIPSKNLLIEYNGEQHFNVITSRNYKMNKKDLSNNKYRDYIKVKYTQLHNIKLLCIKYTKFSQIEQILQLTLTS